MIWNVENIPNWQLGLFHINIYIVIFLINIIHYECTIKKFQNTSKQDCTVSMVLCVKNEMSEFGVGCWLLKPD